MCKQEPRKLYVSTPSGVSVSLDPEVLWNHERRRNYFWREREGKPRSGDVSQRGCCFKWPLLRGVRFRQVDKRMSVTDRGINSWKPQIYGDPTSSPDGDFGQYKVFVPQDILLPCVRKLLLTTQSHGSVKVNGAPCGRTVCISFQGKQRPWVCECIKYQVRT